MVWSNSLLVSKLSIKMEKSLAFLDLVFIFASDILMTKPWKLRLRSPEAKTLEKCLFSDSQNALFKIATKQYFDS